MNRDEYLQRVDAAAWNAAANVAPPTPPEHTDVMRMLEAAGRAAADEALRIVADAAVGQPIPAPSSSNYFEMDWKDGYDAGVDWSEMFCRSLLPNGDQP